MVWQVVDNGDETIALPVTRALMPSFLTYIPDASLIDALLFSQ